MHTPPDKNKNNRPILFRYRERIAVLAVRFLERKSWKYRDTKAGLNARLIVVHCLKSLSR